MNLAATIDRAELRAAAQRADRLVRSVSSCFPVLAGALVEVDPSGTISLTVDKLDWRASVAAGAASEGFAPGAVIVAPGELCAALGALDSRSAALEVKDGRLSLNGGRRAAAISILAASEDYPAPRDPGPVLGEAKGAEVGAAISAVLYAASGDAVLENHMHGVAVRGRDGRLDVSATNGHRGARCSFASGQGAFDEALVPLEVARELVRGPGGGWRVCRYAGAYSIATGGVEVVGRPTDVPFPNLDHAISNCAWPHAATLPRAVLLDFLAAAGKLTAKNYWRAACLDLSEGELLLSAVVDDVAGTKKHPRKAGNERVVLTERVPVVAGGSAKVCVNPRYLVEAVEPLPSDEVRVEFGSGGDDPIAVRGAVAGCDYFALVMPMRA